MIFELRIKKDCDESVVATVHERTPLVDEIERLVLQESVLDKVVGYEEDSIVMISISDVESFSSEGDKVFAHLRNGKSYQIKRRLYELEETLPKEFVRISKSALANWTQVARLNVQLSGVVNVVFKSGYSDYISRRCFAEIKRRYGL